MNSVERGTLENNSKKVERRMCTGDKEENDKGPWLRWEKRQVFGVLESRMR